MYNRYDYIHTHIYTHVSSLEKWLFLGLGLGNRRRVGMSHTRKQGHHQRLLEFCLKGAKNQLEQISTHQN